MVRALAWLIDLLVEILIIIVARLVIGLIAPNLGFLSGMMLITVFLVLWLYNLLLEWLWQGFTPGKKALGIRVISSNGLPLTFSGSFLRNTLRYADFAPLFYGVGLVSMFLSGRFQRLGDIAGNTLVVYVQDSRNTKPLTIKNKQVEKLCDELSPEVLSLVDAETVKAIAAYANSRLHYHPDRRNEIAAHLAVPIAQHIGLTDYKPDILLSALYMLLFHGDSEQSMGSKAAQFLSKRRPLWQRLEKLLNAKPSVQKEHAEEIARHYRAVCADLALADAYQLPPQNINYLHGLVSRAHLRFYQRIQVKFKELFTLVFQTIPGRLYNDSCLRIAGIAFFGVFFSCLLIGSMQTDIAADYLGKDRLAHYEDMYVEPVNRGNFEDSSEMGGFYIFNNVGISFQCFASGILIGIGSLIILIYNGIFLGLIFGFMASDQVDPTVQSHFFEFTTAHGPFELCGIMLSGAAGLRLGFGLIITRGLPRLESLQRSAREAVPLMCVAASCVAIAAPIEAFISPSALPIAAKISVQLLSIAVLLGYFLLGAKYKEADLMKQQEVLYESQ